MMDYLLSSFGSNFNLAVDHSRVILDNAEPNIVGSDYINANYVGVSFLL